VPALNAGGAPDPKVKAGGGVAPKLKSIELVVAPNPDCWVDWVGWDAPNEKEVGPVVGVVPNEDACPAAGVVPNEDACPVADVAPNEGDGPAVGETFPNETAGVVAPKAEVIAPVPNVLGAAPNAGSVDPAPKEKPNCVFSVGFVGVSRLKNEVGALSPATEGSLLGGVVPNWNPVGLASPDGV
jgi:hypothetical protein